MKKPPKASQSAKSHSFLPQLMPQRPKDILRYGKKKNAPVYTEVEIDGEKTTLSVATNRIEPIVPYRVASSKLPHVKEELKKAYHR
jgi:hypothetical protein